MVWSHALGRGSCSAYLDIGSHGGYLALPLTLVLLLHDEHDGAQVVFGLDNGSLNYAFPDFEGKLRFFDRNNTFLLFGNPNFLAGADDKFSKSPVGMDRLQGAEESA